MGNVGWRQKNILGGSLGLLSARQRQRRRRRPTAVERSKSTDHRRMDAMLGVDASVRAACCYPPAPQLGALRMSALIFELIVASCTHKARELLQNTTFQT